MKNVLLKTVRRSQDAVTTILKSCEAAGFTAAAEDEYARASVQFALACGDAVAEMRSTAAKIPRTQRATQEDLFYSDERTNMRAVRMNSNLVYALRERVAQRTDTPAIRQQLILAERRADRWWRRAEDEVPTGPANLTKAAKVHVGSMYLAAVHALNTRPPLKRAV